MVTSPQSPERPLARMRPPHLVFPIVLIGIGIALLLITTGAVSEDAGWRLLQLWPVLLILIGIELVFTWAVPNVAGRVLTAITLVVLMLAAVVYATVAPSGGANSTGSDFSAATGTVQQPLLVIDAAGTNIKLESASLGDNLYSAHFDIATGGQPRAQLDAANSRLTVSIEHQLGGIFSAPGRSDSVAVRLNDQLPWDIQLNGAGINTTADVSGLNLHSVRISGAGTKLTATLPAPSGIVPVEVSGVGCTITLTVPAGTAASTTGTGVATSVTNNTTGASGLDRYEISVSGVATKLTVNEVQP
jgi:hypothetical protein